MVGNVFVLYCDCITNTVIYDTDDTTLKKVTGYNQFC